MRLAFHLCGAVPSLDLQGLLVLLLAGMTSASVATDLPPWVSGTGRSWGANHIQTVEKTRIPPPSLSFLQWLHWFSVPFLPC